MQSIRHFIAQPPENGDGKPLAMLLEDGDPTLEAEFLGTQQVAIA